MVHRIKKVLIASSLIFSLVIQSSFMFFSPVLAKADDLVIQDNGSVVLIITDGSAVLAAESVKKPKAPEKPAPAPVTSTKVVVPPKSESTVKIDSKPSNDNKVKITVQTPAAPTTQAGTKPAPAPQTSSQQNTSQTLPTSKPGTQNVNSSPQTAVDKVVLNGPDQKPIITISGQDSKQLNIQNGSVNLSTNLPVQVDNNVSPTGAVSHDLSVTTPNGPVKLSVLPEIAVKAAETQVVNSSLPVVKKDVTLAQNSSIGIPGSDPTYIVKEQRKGKFMGIVGITLNSQVDISATNGKTVSSWQSPLSIFSFLIK